MKYCSLCKNKVIGKDCPTFQVPKDDRRRIKWSEICRMQFTKYARLCADHFLPTDIIWRGKKHDLMPNAVPHVQVLAEDMSVCNTLKLDDSGIISTEFEQCSEDLFLDTAMGVPVDVDICKRRHMQTQTNLEYRDSQTQTNVESRDSQTQTDPVILECTIQMKKEEDGAKIKRLEAENKELQLKLAKVDAVFTFVQAIFTKGQIRKIMSPGNIQWQWNDISNAICLHAAGPRAYNHLYKKGFPLPHVSTLQRWARKVDISEGYLSTAVEFMKHGDELSVEDKICVLAFDEMKVAETYEYDAIGDVVRNPAKYVQVVIARGLRKSWMQPVFFDYDCPMNKTILHSIITGLKQAGFPVVAIVCDMGPTNRKIWRELGVTPDKPWFPNPVNAEDKVFAFADAPHLLKLVRNHFLDSGLLWNNGLLTSRTILDLMKHTSRSDTSIVFKLTEEHLSVKGVGRQKVKLAAQLFSNTTANAIRWCYSVGLDLYQPTETADFIQLVNDWFDVLNSSLNTFHYPGKEPFGIAVDEQKHILTRMNKYMSSPIIPTKKSLECFQRGIIQTNNALVMLHDYVKKYDMTYIVTTRLNQDVEEHFFGAMRSKGGLHDHPSPMGFKYRLRKYILAKGTEYLQGTGNVQCDTTQWIGSSTMAISNNKNMRAEVCDADYQQIEQIEDSEMNNLDDLDPDSFDDIGNLHEDALEYIAGYIIRKRNLHEYESQENSFTWVDQVSKVSLKKPSSNFLNSIKRLESVFFGINKRELCNKRSLKRRVVEKSVAIDLPDHIKAFFFKCRIHFRVRHLNRLLETQKAKQRLMRSKKFFKITT